MTLLSERVAPARTRCVLVCWPPKLAISISLGLGFSFPLAIIVNAERRRKAGDGAHGANRRERITGHCWLRASLASKPLSLLLASPSPPPQLLLHALRCLVSGTMHLKLQSPASHHPPALATRIEIATRERCASWGRMNTSGTCFVYGFVHSHPGKAQPFRLPLVLALHV